MNSPELRKQIEDNESGLYKVSCTLPLGDDINDSGIRQDMLVSDRATMESVVHAEKSYTKNKRFLESREILCLTCFRVLTH